MGMKCYYIGIQQDVLLDVFYQHSSVPHLMTVSNPTFKSTIRPQKLTVSICPFP